MRFPMAALLAVLPSFAALAADAPEGLRLEAKAAATSVEAGAPIEIRVRLVNGSKTATHPVVRSNDGSEAGWREPHVFWSASRVGEDGQDAPLTAGAIGRCGLYANDWTKDVTRLAPGEAIDLEWMMPVGHSFDLQEAGHYRIVAHYAWRAGKTEKGGPGAPPTPEAIAAAGLAGVAPYELVSNAVDVVVVRPVEVVAESKGATAKVGRAVRLSDLVAVRVENRSNRARRFASPEMRLHFHARPPASAAFPGLAPAGAYPKPDGRALAPGATLAVLGPGGVATDLEITFRAPGPHAIALGVGFESGVVRSNWVEVTVVE